MGTQTQATTHGEPRLSAAQQAWLLWGVTQGVTQPEAGFCLTGLPLHLHIDSQQAGCRRLTLKQSCPCACCPCRPQQPLQCATAICCPADLNGLVSEQPFHPAPTLTCLPCSPNELQYVEVVIVTQAWLHPGHLLSGGPAGLVQQFGSASGCIAGVVSKCRGTCNAGELGSNNDQLLPAASADMRMLYASCSSGVRCAVSAGLNGQSSVREVELQTGKVLRKKMLSKLDFGEGLVKFKNRWPCRRCCTWLVALCCI